MVWSCLQDCMGVAYANHPRTPTSAQIVTAAFGYFAGEADEELLRNHLGHSFDMVPRNRQWEQAIERVYGNSVTRRLRYATHKEVDAFDTAKLRAIVAALPRPYELRRIDAALYRQVMALEWAADLCENFAGQDDFLANGLGILVLRQGEIVSGASSYTYYRGGIEIEIDTRQDQRRRGLALACGAQLILDCLDQNLYPSWDVYSLDSLALAQKLGYHLAGEYPIYTF